MRSWTTRRTLALAVVAIGTFAPLLTASPAAGATAEGARCSLSDSGRSALDPSTGQTVVCAPGQGGLLWRTGVAATPAPTAPTRPAPPTASPRPAAGGRCAVAGSTILDAATAEELLCTDGAAGRSWVGQGVGAQLAPLETPVVDGDAGAGLGPDALLPPDLGNPTGLPPGVSLPPGMAVLPGYPFSTKPLDYWKRNRWITMGTIAGSNDAAMEAVHEWFVGQCAAIDWYFDPERVERLPDDPTPGRFYDEEVRMVLGECRTYLGTLTHPVGRRPWVLAWSATLRPGSPRIEVVVELRDSTRTGGRTA
jgi:hypothetical protein